MQLHLAEIATKVSPGAHAILILDQAGWHDAKDLKVPSNISLLPLPPRSPELNSQENIWQSSCGRTGCPTASSNPSMTLSTTAATPGTQRRESPAGLAVTAFTSMRLRGGSPASMLCPNPIPMPGIAGIARCTIILLHESRS
jgi:hypothetical protein